jgi:hypothetical protein
MATRHRAKDAATSLNQEKLHRAYHLGHLLTVQMSELVRILFRLHESGYSNARC